MSARLGAPARLIWSLAGSNLGTTINASGSSGAWTPTPWTPSQANAVTPLDLRDVEDLWITAMCTGVSGTTPSMALSLNVFDDQGNAWPAATVGAISGAGVANGKQLSVGKHGLAAAAYVIFPMWGQIAWVVTGTTPVFTGVDIAVFAR